MESGPFVMPLGYMTPTAALMHSEVLDWIEQCTMLDAPGARLRMFKGRFCAWQTVTVASALQSQMSQLPGRDQGPFLLQRPPTQETLATWSFEA